MAEKKYLNVTNTKATVNNRFIRLGTEFCSREGYKEYTYDCIMLTGSIADVWGIYYVCKNEDVKDSLGQILYSDEETISIKREVIFISKLSADRFIKNVINSISPNISLEFRVRHIPLYGPKDKFIIPIDDTYDEDMLLYYVNLASVFNFVKRDASYKKDSYCSYLEYDKDLQDVYTLVLASESEDPSIFIFFNKEEITTFIEKYSNDNDLNLASIVIQYHNSFSVYKNKEATKYKIPYYHDDDILAAHKAILKLAHKRYIYMPDHYSGILLNKDEDNKEEVIDVEEKKEDDMFKINISKSTELIGTDLSDLIDLDFRGFFIEYDLKRANEYRELMRFILAVDNVAFGSTIASTRDLKFCNGHFNRITISRDDESEFKEGNEENMIIHFLLRSTNTLGDTSNNIISITVAKYKEMSDELRKTLKVWITNSKDMCSGSRRCGYSDNNIVDL